jgi:hypothetical protein
VSRTKRKRKKHHHETPFLRTPKLQRIGFILTGLILITVSAVGTFFSFQQSAAYGLKAIMLAVPGALFGHFLLSQAKKYK